MNANYQVEGFNENSKIKFNFNEELYKSLNNEKKKEDICLISHSSLEKFHIVLDCKHTFNYIPLYNEVKNQKIGLSSHVDIKKLNVSEIKCPYCRNIQKGILPSYPFIKTHNISKKFGINTPEKYVKKKNKCDVIIKSGKRKGEKCNKSCYFEKCKYHLNKEIDTEENNTEENKKQNKKISRLRKDEKCNSIVKSGKNKGKCCSNRAKHIYNNKKYCGLHYKMLNTT